MKHSPLGVRHLFRGKTTRLNNIIKNFLENITPETKEFFLAPDEYKALLSDCFENEAKRDMMPQPPVKTRDESWGFFSYSYKEERDHHAPQYLKDLKEWEKRQELKRQNISNEIVFLGPYGTIKIKLKQNMQSSITPSRSERDDVIIPPLNEKP